MLLKCTLTALQNDKQLQCESEKPGNCKDSAKRTRTFFFAVFVVPYGKSLRCDINGLEAAHNVMVITPGESFHAKVMAGGGGVWKELTGKVTNCQIWYLFG